MRVSGVSKTVALWLALCCVALLAAGCRGGRVDPPRAGRPTRGQEGAAGVADRTLALNDAARGQTFNTRVYYPAQGRRGRCR